jgi:hypothetical protein
VRRPLRFALASLGLVAAVYGAASLTGGWLGTPPWWESWTPWERSSWDQKSDPEDVRFTRNGFEYLKPGEDREWISYGVTALGFGIAAFALMPWRVRRVYPA